MNIKQFAIGHGLWEEAGYFTEITQEEKEFLLKAQVHYCNICDLFFKDRRSTRGHIRLKHQGGMKAKNA